MSVSRKKKQMLCLVFTRRDQGEQLTPGIRILISLE